MCDFFVPIVLAADLDLVSSLLFLCNCCASIGSCIHRHGGHRRRRTVPELQVRANSQHASTLAKSADSFLASASCVCVWSVMLKCRYNPHNPLPEWYSPVDLESDRDMWK